MIYTYKKGTGIGRLAKDLRLSIAWPYHNLTKKRSYDVDINWGVKNLLVTEGTPEILNVNIANATSKVACFGVLKSAGILVPRWDISYEALRERLQGAKITILARKDELSKGRGIRKVDETSPDIPSADFYVERLSCLREARIHVWRDRIICEQVKYLPEGCESFIHNFENGATYSSNSKLEKFFTAEQAELARLNSIEAIKALSLAFGAVDVMLTKKGKVYILEVNTAPGIRAASTYGAYREALKGRVKEKYSAQN